MSKVKLGDIILFKSDGSLQDAFIHMVSKDYTHIGIYMGNNTVVEAGINGVREFMLTPSYVSLSHVYRIQNVSDLKLNNMVNLALSHVGEKYSVMDAAFAGILRLFGLKQWSYSVDSNWFCSEFVAYTIESSYGLDRPDIFPKKVPKDVLPDDFKTANDIEYLGRYSDLA